MSQLNSVKNNNKEDKLLNELDEIEKVSIKNKKNIIQENVKTGVVITTHGYNGVYIRQCLECFIRELPDNFFIVVYINESNDSITLALQNSHATSNIQFIYVEDQKKNGGLTGTWNRGIALCVENDCDVIIISNDDILFDHSINNIIWQCYKKQNEKCYFAPLTNKPGPNKCKLNMNQYALHPRNIESFISKYNNSMVNLNGFFMVFSKNVLITNNFDSIHYFDPSYQFAGNEVEWFNRFKEKGGVPIIVPKTFVYHYKLASWRKKNNTYINQCIYVVNTGLYDGKKLRICSNKKVKIPILYYTDHFLLIYKCIKKGIIPFYVSTTKETCKLKQRIIKANPCNFLPYQYNISVYVDANLVIKNVQLFMTELDRFVKKNNYNICCYSHPTRTRVIDESKVVISENLEKKDNVSKITSQFDTYKFKDNIGLTETNMIMRRHKLLTEFSNDWCNSLYSCIRDQIIFDFLLFKHNIMYYRGSDALKKSMIEKKTHINHKGVRRITTKS